MYYFYIFNDYGLFGSQSVTLLFFSLLLSSFALISLSFLYRANLFSHISDWTVLGNCGIYLYVYTVYIQMLVWRIQRNHVFIFS